RTVRRRHGREGGGRTTKTAAGSQGARRSAEGRGRFVMSDKVRYEVSGSVATVTIARPDVRNAMDMEVFSGLADAGARAGADPAVRAVVVTGEGPNFSSRIDTSVFTSGNNGSPSDIDIGRLQSSFTIFEQIV